MTGIPDTTILSTAGYSGPTGGTGFTGSTGGTGYTGATGGTGFTGSTGESRRNHHMPVGRRFDFGNLTPKPERILIALAIMQILGC